VTLQETESVTGHLTILKLVCHTAEHYGEEYDDWNSAVFRSASHAAKRDGAL